MKIQAQYANPCTVEQKDVEAFYNEHPEALFITPDEICRIEFFAGYVTGVDDPAWKISFESDEEFETRINDAKERSWLNSDIYPAVTDKILTLSICSYEFDNARFVLPGIVYNIY